MSNLFAAHSPFRIFAFSALASLAILVGVFFGVGAGALLLTLILAVVELTFSFDNAIINAKVLSKLARPWQVLFLTAGILVAIFGMRVIFPIVIVMITASLGWSQVIDLALHHPHEYAHHLEQAHASIAAFGGAFLLMLALTFFFDDEKHVHWIGRIEQRVSRFSHWSIAPLVAVAFVVGCALLPANDHAAETVVAGLLGAGTYILLQAVNGLFTRIQGERAQQAGQTGVAALLSLLYLEVLDASFSFDGVIGAFAITSNIILIAAGLGIGALWVRSLTVFMVRRRTLGRYIYVEHGAHYTVLILAFVLLASIILDISNYIPGLIGIGIIGASIAASVRERRRKVEMHRERAHF
jgi:hypothetical protein